MPVLIVEELEQLIGMCNAYC